MILGAQTPSIRYHKDDSALLSKLWVRRYSRNHKSYHWHLKRLHQAFFFNNMARRELEIPEGTGFSSLAQAEQWLFHITWYISLTDDRYFLRLHHSVFVAVKFPTTSSRIDKIASSLAFLSVLKYTDITLPQNSAPRKPHKPLQKRLYPRAFHFIKKDESP